MPKYTPRVFTEEEQAQFRALTIDERVRAMWKFQAEDFEKLRADPEAYDAFIRRNFKKRAISVPPGGFE